MSKLAPQAIDLNSRLTLTLREASKAIGVSERTLWQWVKDGKIPAFKAGRLNLIPVDGLRAVIEAKSTGSGAI